MVYDFLILGAGISGALIASQLRATGKTVCIIDKGRSVGGRLCCKRFGSESFNHGLENMDCKPFNRPWIQNLIANGTIEATAPHKIFVPANQIVKKILDDTAFIVNEEIATLSVKNSFYEALSKNGKVWQSQKVICTFPAAQALKLLENQLASDAIANLNKVTYSKKLICFVTLAKELFSCTDYSAQRQGPIHMLSFSEPIAEKLFEFQDSQILQELGSLFPNVFGSTDNKMTVLKKWRYGLCQQAIDKPYLISADQKIILAGDYLGSSNLSSLERTISSAEAVLSLLHTAHSF